MKNNTNTTETFAPVLIGVDPCGVEWVAYTPAKVEPMRKAFAKRRAMTQRRVRGLCSDSMFIIHDSIAERSGHATTGCDWVDARQHVLDTIADWLDVAASEEDDRDGKIAQRLRCDAASLRG